MNGPSVQFGRASASGVRAVVFGSIVILAGLASASQSPAEARSPADQTAFGQLHPQRLIIGLDLSKSSPLIDDPAFAAQVGGKVGKIVRDLDFASEVHVRTFGNYDAPDNSFAYDVVVSVHNRPEHVANEIERLISGVPLLVRKGKFKPQWQTNILAFVENMFRATSCKRMPTTFILASDGIEDSEYVRLEKSDGHLPKPRGRPYRDCAGLAIYGIGRGMHSPTATNRLRAEWLRWSSGAGFKTFVGLNDW